jgi:hypothetical protein
MLRQFIVSKTGRAILFQCLFNVPAGRAGRGTSGALAEIKLFPVETIRLPMFCGFD